MVPIYKTVKVGENEQQVLHVEKMEKVGAQMKVYDKVIIYWI